MSRIHSKDTLPEKRVRSLLYKLGYRFRIHRTDLPGKPDIVLQKYKMIIFVHGCFWHYHQNCKKAGIPKSNTDFWKNKIQKNIERDLNNITLLKNSGWNVNIIWECETENNEKLTLTILDIFRKSNNYV